MRLVNTKYPYLTVIVDAGPPLIQRRFAGGILEVADDDPYADRLREIAAADPNTSIHVSRSSDGRESVVKSAAARDLVCEICVPTQTFDDAEGLAEHTMALHADRPMLGAEGEDTSQTDAPRAQARVRVRKGTHTT